MYVQVHVRMLLKPACSWLNVRVYINAHASMFGSSTDGLIPARAIALECGWVGGAHEQISHLRIHTMYNIQGGLAVQFAMHFVHDCNSKLSGVANF